LNEPLNCYKRIEMSRVQIRKVHNSEARAITDLGLRSKAYWGYDDAFMQACKLEMTHTPGDLSDSKCVYRVAEQGGSLVGFYKLLDLTASKVCLDALFVDPPFIGRGVGTVLFEHAVKVAKGFGAQHLVTQSDPFAEKFYLALGGKLVGQLESGSIDGRFLPLIEFDLAA